MCNGAGQCLSSVFQTSSIAGTNPTCPSGQTAIMKANSGIWYTSTATQVASSWSQVACGTVLTSDGTPLLVIGAHTTKQCTDAGGTVVSDGSSSFCRFDSASCPAGSPNWVQYSNWSTLANATAYSPAGCDKTANFCTTTGAVHERGRMVPPLWSNMHA